MIWGWIFLVMFSLNIMLILCARLWVEEIKIAEYNRGLVMGRAAAEVTLQEQQRILRAVGIDPDTLPDHP